LEKKRVLYGASPGAFKSRGGGEVLLLKSKQYAEKLGFEIEVFDGSQNFADFDLFHNFNLHRDCFGQLKKAKEAGLAVVVSPVYWPSLKYALKWNQGLGKKAGLLGVELLNRLDLFGLTKVSRMLEMADLVTPSSVAEAAVLERMFKLRPEKVSLIHNGVDARFQKATKKAFLEKFGLEGFVLYVGRIEERKNVLALVRAMKGLGEKLVVMGDAKAGSEGYAKKCLAEAGGNAVFLPGVSHEDRLLASAYAACGVFALPSWYETPGLAALEAGLAGANIVVTGEGCTREYFSGFASYARPESVKDIREKVLLELGKPKGLGLKRHILQNFLWENTAAETKAAYERALKVN
jgi:glycosyltransferase involved in cell wall biosynthesis